MARPRNFRRFRHPATSAAAAAWLAIGLAGCASKPGEITGSIAGTPSANNPAQTYTEWRQDAETAGSRYRANPKDPRAALQYAKALRALGQRPQAVAVLEQASMVSPNNKEILGAYGRALADVGQYKQALDVLERAHTPDNPDWHILSVQGAVLDQMGRHQEAQAYYSSALKIVPNDPSVLSNLGLSYALAKDLPKAEATLRQAMEAPGADARVRQNLALVVGLQGRFAEAESIARADLPPDEAAANADYLKQMIADAKAGKKIGSAAAAGS